jgi:hypothetical protein
MVHNQTLVTLREQEAGDLRRGKIKEDFEAEDRTLSTLDAGLKTLTAELESAAAEAERAAAAETAAESNSETVPSSISTPAQSSNSSDPAARQPSNPYSEYRSQSNQAALGTVPKISP